jgi:hypothetical protein
MRHPVPEDSILSAAWKTFAKIYAMSLSLSDIFLMHKHEFICGQFESWLLCIELESDSIIELSKYFI